MYDKECETVKLMVSASDQPILLIIIWLALKKGTFLDLEGTFLGYKGVFKKIILELTG